MALYPTEQERERMRREDKLEEIRIESERKKFLREAQDALDAGQLPEFLWKHLSQKSDKGHKHNPEIY